MSHIDLWPEEPAVQADQIETGFVLENASGERQRFWYRLSAEQKPALSQSCDPYVLPVVFIAMQKHADLIVHGQVSPSLLKNLTEFQATWASWRPKVYKQVEITADLETESARQAERGVLTGFSGGVDSAFTVWRHHNGQAGRQNQKIQAGLMVHGFDIRLNQPEVFARAAQKSQSLLDSVGLKLITIVTNLKKTSIDFEDAHPAVLASCMMLLQGSYSMGMIPSSYPYDHLFIPWGSNPITDRLLSSAAFTVMHDGAAFSRLDKVKSIASWPEIAQYLRVCVRGKERDENCCRCEKCIRTILEFRVLGLGLPTCFKRDATDLQILQMTNPGSVHHYHLILEAAKAHQINASWVYALKWSRFYNASILRLKHIRRNNAGK